MSNGVNSPASGYTGTNLVEAGSGWGSATEGRRDKRGSPGEPQATGVAWVLACRLVGARAAYCILNNANKDNLGTAGAFARLEGRL